MKLIGLKPSSALSVTSDTPVRECIEMMANRNIGSILILGGAGGDVLEGIITERDVVRRFRELASPEAENLPVWRFMTSKVISLPLSQLHSAAATMLANNIRHIVLTYDEPGAADRVAGLLSLRDLFRTFNEIFGAKLEPFSELHKRILLISDVDSSRKLFRALLSRFEGMNFKVVESYAPELPEAISQAETLFLDLDHLKSTEWARLLKMALGRAKPPSPVVVIFNPLTIPKQMLAVLGRISETGAMQILEKPVTVTDVIAILREHD